MSETQYDEQVTAFTEDGSDGEYAEVIVGAGNEQLELFVQGFSLGQSVAVSVMLTPRGARMLAQRLLAAADVAEDNEA